MIDRRTGAAGRTYGIGFALALPENWNGRFLFQGGGGLNGNVGNPLGTQATGDTPALARGFAVVSTDTGHQGQGAFDGSFMQDQQAALDFAYVAVGRVAVLAKQIVAQHYGKPVDKSYFVGCSTGGREAMLMAQRYPLYLDGIVAGAPAMRTGYSEPGDTIGAVALNQVAPKDASGQPIPGQAFSESDKKLDHRRPAERVRRQRRPEGRDDLQHARLQVRSEDAGVRRRAKKDGCLSSQQAAAIEKAFAGPKDSKGTQVYPGFPYDTGITASTGGIPGLLSPGQSPLGPPNRSCSRTSMPKRPPQAAELAGDPERHRELDEPRPPSRGTAGSSSSSTA